MARRPSRRSARSGSSMRRSSCRACCRCRSTIISPRIFRARCSSMSTRSPIMIDPLPHMYPDAAQFARDVAALGISTGDTVVAYDSGGWVAAPRAWWMFLSFGHRNVKVLDGGLKKWRAKAVRRSPARSRRSRERSRPGSIRNFVRSQQQVLEQYRDAGRAVGRCAPAAAFRGHGRGAAAGAAFRPYSRQPQRALCRVVRRRRPAR